ncbi:hypothetical protein P9D51_18420 [Bacillus sonorensis]|uniref:hypothetical protein n=1 Tax=Bacillus sonorensis TaxID=119858 RepID=UPI001F26079F|nr:hypothetical protein [Bacillus sonorensis]MCF7616709.1 hypothetical protein [Bacillus sonorensis]MCY7857366.1 hypothetical protein [Bacillus sonorensis]MCY8033757.1 hypothetical protein [Bacillus sonorensis]MCY8086188.1 hypothetical protein [Bacillus sonorensis]MCY8562442.1 hypothetical protein [Bacillus sonorensis]
MIGLLIIACEIGFWAFILLGLFFRYIANKKKISLFFLAATPVLDLVLLIATAIDLHNGATADTFHGLAAIYIGVSIAFGSRMIKWADVRFAHRFAGGPKPDKGPRYGKEHAKKEREGWIRHFAAWAIGAGLLAGLHLFIGDFERTQSLLRIASAWSIILAIDFIYSFSFTIFPKKTP